MRTELLSYLKALKFKNFNVSEELPFSNSGVALYLKNAKRLYLSLEQIAQEPFISVFGNSSIDAEVYSVKLYFTTDAKQLPSDYSTVVSQIRGAKSVETTDNYFRREVITGTTYENDLMVTEFEFRFTKLK